MLLVFKLGLPLGAPRPSTLSRACTFLLLSLLQAKETGVTAKPLRMDSQVKYGLLARGDAARVFMRFPSASYREKIWDHAAGLVVVEEAGGKVRGRIGCRQGAGKTRRGAV